MDKKLFLLTAISLGIALGATIGTSRAVRADQNPVQVTVDKESCHSFDSKWGESASCGPDEVVSSVGVLGVHVVAAYNHTVPHPHGAYSYVPANGSAWARIQCCKLVVVQN